MKKRILGLILALSMVLSVLPLGAFAEGSTNGKELVMKNGLPDTTGMTLQEGKYVGNGWEYSNGTLYLTRGEYDFSSTYPQTPNATGAQPVPAVMCAIEIEWGAEITGGTFSTTVENTFGGRISGGTFNGEVENSGTINGNGTFNGEVTNKFTIENGTFNGTVKNNETIENGTFNGTVTNDAFGTISGGTFAGSVDNSNDGGILGGVFNGNKKPTNVTGGHNIKWDDAYSQAKIEKVNGVSAEWDPYVVVGELTMNQKVIITADTEIFSLNGYPIDGSPYTSSYPKPNDKTTVKFTMPDDKDVVLNEEITQGGDLVMEGGYPKISNGGKYSCSGNGWTYSEKNISNLTGKLTLTSNSGTFDFSYTYPQNTSKGSGAEPVACAVVTQSGVTITGGTFEGEVNNSGTIERGTFAGGVTNSGTITNGTFACSVTNYGTINSKGTFNGTVENGPEGTISNGTFKGIVTNNAGGEISGGTFKETVINSDGTISGGTFAGSVNNRNGGTVTGGVFNGNAKPTVTTGGYNITWDAASPKAKIKKVNGVSANWAPYAYAGTTVTITADTEIYSLNGQPIAESSYGSDKTTVTFTMPNENVVLGTGELVMQNSYPVGSNNGTADCEGNGWSYDHSTDTLTLTSGTFDFSSTHPQKPSEETRPAPAVQCVIESYATITGGIFDRTVTNNAGGTISDGTFYGTVTNNGTITGNSIFKETVTNNARGEISGGTFYGTVTNSGYIKDGTFNGKVTNRNTIENGTFAGSVTNEGTIKNGSFEKKVTNSNTIMDGVFKGVVENGGNGTIFGGTFAGSVNNSYGGHIFGGVFNGHINVPGFGVYPITVDTASSKAEIKEVNGVSAVWEPYVVVAELTMNQKVIITASTEIYSLNHKPIGAGNCNSSQDSSDKNTVKFTMPKESVVLNGAITSTDLVMENGWPKDSNGGKNPARATAGSTLKMTRPMATCCF